MLSARVVSTVDNGALTKEQRRPENSPSTNGRTNGRTKERTNYKKLYPPKNPKSLYFCVALFTADR